MANSGRTVPKFIKFYQNGYDLTGETSSVGELGAEYGFESTAALNWGVKGGYNDRATVQVGQLNTILRFDTTAALSPHDWIKGMDATLVNVMVPIGIRADPMLGDPVFAALQRQKSSKVVSAGAGLVVGTIDYSPTVDDALTLTFDNPWGTLLHAATAETAVNTAVGHDGLAATSKGAWMTVQVFAAAGAGTVTIKVQDAAVNTNVSFADVAGLSLAFANTAAPTAGFAQTAVGATIRQFTRWQIVLAGVTSVTFALALMRGR